MKKFSIFLPVLVASFFLLLPNVRAEEYTYTIPDDVISFTKDNLSIIKNSVENFIDNNSDIYSSSYIIDYYPAISDYKYSVYIFKKKYNLNRIYLMQHPSWKLTLYEDSQCDWLFLSDDFSSVSYRQSCDNFIPQIYYYHFILYSNFDFSYLDSSNSFIYIFKDTQFTEPISNDLKFSTIYDMYNEYYSEPPDNTPILTNFYSVVGSKVGWLGEQIVSNYIYLSIIGVFILIFLIEFIRRYFL